MQKFVRRTYEIEALQWFPPGHDKHVPIEGMYSKQGITRYVAGKWETDLATNQRHPNSFYLPYGVDVFGAKETHLIEGEWLVWRDGKFVGQFNPGYFEAKFRPNSMRDDHDRCVVAICRCGHFTLKLTTCEVCNGSIPESIVKL